MNKNEVVFQVILASVFICCCGLAFWIGNGIGLDGVLKWTVVIFGGSLLTIGVAIVIFWLMFKFKK